ncbi:MAG: CCA tRNA nucleotidyltransferase [Planctomycetota bacterium]|jgi:poly(A) polymerase
MAGSSSQQTALWVVKQLRKAGHQALFAGGCVRDYVLGAPCSDYDVATDATPVDVSRLFPRVLMVGAKFGVAMVLRRHESVEVATFRTDSSYSDGRRPDSVTYCSPEEDAKRRDFTINGMFYDPIAEEVIDYVGGQSDLTSRVIRTIGVADERFGEDYLRMVRAVRFAARLDFRIHADTETAIQRHAPRITSISGERIFDELSKMLSEPTALRALTDLHRLGMIQHIVPELFGRDGQWADVMRRVEAVGGCKDLQLTLGAVLVGLGREAIGPALRRWGASNELRSSIAWMAEHIDDWRKAPDLPLCDFKRLIACAHFDRLCLLWLSEEQAATGTVECHRRMRERLTSIDPNLISPPPFVTGDDLMAMGLTEGPQLGDLLRGLYDAQLNEDIVSRCAALTEARRLVEQDSA